MSETVIGYDKDGRRIVRDDGPARARPAGFGGAALGQATATFTLPRRKPAGTTEETAAQTTGPRRPR